MLNYRDRVVLTVLLIIGILLPIGSMFLFFAARVLNLFGSETGSAPLDAVAIGMTVLWLIDFVALVFALTIRLLIAEHGVSKNGTKNGTKNNGK